MENEGQSFEDRPRPEKEWNIVVRKDREKTKK